MIPHVSVWICQRKLQKYAQWYTQNPPQRLSRGSFLLGNKHELSSPAVLPSRLIVFDTMSNTAISISTFTAAPFGNEQKVIDQVAINLRDRGSRDHHYTMMGVLKWLSTWACLHAVQLWLFCYFSFGVWKRRETWHFPYAFTRTIKDFKSCTSVLSFILVQQLVPQWWVKVSSGRLQLVRSHHDKNVSVRVDMASSNSDRIVMARGQPIFSCSIIDATVHSLPPFLAFVLSPETLMQGEWQKTQCRQGNTAWRRVCMRLHGRATHTHTHTLSSWTLPPLSRYWTYSACGFSLRQNTLYRRCDTTEGTRSAQRS